MQHVIALPIYNYISDTINVKSSTHGFCLSLKHIIKGFELLN